MTTTARPPKLIGEPIKRREDPRLITGQGTYVDDLQPPGTLHLAVVRSPYAHARVTRIDASTARKAPGVVAVLTPEEVRQSSEPIPVAARLEGMALPVRYALTGDEVRFVGEPVVAVVAEDRYLAADAAELVEVEYEELPVVVDPERALEEGAALVHEEMRANLCVVSPIGDAEAADRAIEGAEVVIRQRLLNQRLIPNPIEPRAVLAHYEPGPATMTVWSSTQIPHLLKTLLSECVRLPEQRFRVVAPDVGGGFGCKLNVYPEEILAALASRRLERPVKFVETRQENYVATIHGRDLVGHLELAAKRDGTLVGYRVKVIADIGAYQHLLTAGIPTLTAMMLQGVYKIPALYGEILEVFTNKTPTDAYRGAGRPEATYYLERAMDLLAAELGMDPAELRRMNFIQPNEFPFETETGLTYDSGDYEAALDKALAMAGYAELRKEQSRLRGEGRYLGVGMSTYVELCGVGPSSSLPWGGWEMGTVRVERTGKVTVLTGVSPHGQGAETSFAQIAAERMGVGMDDVTVIHGDTAQVSAGIGTFGSRSLAVGGTAMVMSLDKVEAKVKRFAAHAMEVQVEDLEFEAGRVFVKGSPAQAMTLPEIATLAYNAVDLPPETEPGLEATSYFEPADCTFPFGAHIAVVEVDPESGAIDLQRFISVDDCGNIINPLIVEGQIHGGLAQGIAQALYEEAVYDENGQLLSGSLMDYAVPSADQLPSFELGSTVTPTHLNPLGAKGVGEAGTIGAAPAVVNAVVDALSPLGIAHLEMMLRPQRVWEAIHSARGGHSASGGEPGKGGGR